MAEDRDYYCSMKFRHLKLDLESNNTYNCHAAKPHAVDFDWLSNHPGQLFNTDVNVHERTMMLHNQRNPSCEQNCWFAEDRGAISPRIYQNGLDKTHLQISTYPEILDITVGSDCNLTCSYCCKEYSSSWRRDIDKNGSYPVEQDLDRYQINTRDKILSKISQSELKESRKYTLLLEEAKTMIPHLKVLEITGGEPLLDNQLIDFLSTNDLSRCKVDMFTGLGVNINRFTKMCDSIKNIPNFRFQISAENIGKYLEFNRYGIKWSEFQSKIKIIQDFGIKFKFHATISNLTVFGFREFYDMFNQHEIDLTFAYSPRMMSTFVLDDNSKARLEKDFLDLPEIYRQRLLATIQQTPTHQDKQDISNFLKEFVSRRHDLDLAIFPQTFLDWIDTSDVV